MRRGRAWLPCAPGPEHGWERREGRAGPSTPGGGAEETLPPGGAAREGRPGSGEAPGSRSGCAATFAISTEREADSKKEGEDSYTDCNVHKKKGGAHKCVTPGPSARWFPQ